MDREGMKKALITMIDENPDVDVKIKFYSDDKVISIMNKLYERWESSGGHGIPLDYASDEEIKILYDTACRYTGSRGSVMNMIRRLLGG